MNPAVRNSLAVVAGIIIGGMGNMGIIMISSSIVPLPEGVNPEDFNSMNENMHLYSPKHFLMPFLAHALGTLAGAFTAAKIAASHHKTLALVIGGVFLIGGVIAVRMLPNAPLWFSAADLLLAYLPMGWLGWKLSGGE